MEALGDKKGWEANPRLPSDSGKNKKKSEPFSFPVHHAPPQRVRKYSAGDGSLKFDLALSIGPFKDPFQSHDQHCRAPVHEGEDDRTSED